MKNKKIFSIIVAVLLVNILLFAGIVKDHKVATSELKDGVPSEELKTANVAASANSGDDFITMAIDRKINKKKTLKNEDRKAEKTDDQIDQQNDSDENSDDDKKTDDQDDQKKNNDKDSVDEDKTDDQDDQQKNDDKKSSDEDSAEEKKPDDQGDSEDTPFDIAEPDIFESGEVEYADNQILIKFKKSFNGKVSTDLKNAGIGKLEPMFETESGNWYVAYLHKRSDVNNAMAAVREMKNVVVAEYDFKGEAASIDTDPISNAVSANAMVDQQ